MPVDFKSLLSRTAPAAEKPKPFPAGTYTAVVKSHQFGESKQKGTPFVRYDIALTGPGDDVDPAAFEEAGGMSKLQGRTIGWDFWLTEDAEYRLKDFLQGPCGITLGERSFGETIPEADGKRIKVVVKLSPSQDGKNIYMNIEEAIAAE